MSAAAKTDRYVETFQRHASIFGRVTDAKTAAALQGVVVQITGMPDAFAAWLASYKIPYGKLWPLLRKRPDRTETAADGSFGFCDLPAGRYKLEAVLPKSAQRYASATHRTVVRSAPSTRRNSGVPSFTTCNIALPPTTIEGSVMAASTPIQMAIVRVVGSGETTETAADGSYRIVAVQPGTRAVSVSARGFEPTVSPATLAKAGDTAKVDITMTPIPPVPGSQHREQ
jgi:hypothetical protein